MIRHTDVREDGISQYRGGSIEGTPQTRLISRQYRIEGFKVGPQLDPHYTERCNCTFFNFNCTFLNFNCTFFDFNCTFFYFNCTIFNFNCTFFNFNCMFFNFFLIVCNVCFSSLDLPNHHNFWLNLNFHKYS